MLTRIAIFEGALADGSEERFFAQVRERLEPIWLRFPNVRAVRVLRTRQADAGAIPVVMVLEMDFDDEAALRDCLASDIRTQAHAATMEVLEPFQGRFFHLVCDSRAAG